MEGEPSALFRAKMFTLKPTAAMTICNCFPASVQKSGVSHNATAFTKHLLPSLPSFTALRALWVKICFMLRVTHLGATQH